MMPYKPKVKASHPEYIKKIQNTLREHQLNTVCEAAACPNRAECYERKSATFMILGEHGSSFRSVSNVTMVALSLQAPKNNNMNAKRVIFICSLYN